jgi:UDP-glucose 4-epimerase
MKVLVTGGAGYIGSTVCSALLENGHTPVILDSLTRGREEFVKDRICYHGDIADRALLEQIFVEHPDISHAIHFAALILVPESMREPYKYYSQNVAKSLEFFNILQALGCHRVVFSSSASIYETSNGGEAFETDRVNAKSPYARTKQIMEMILEDIARATKLRGIALRYFNPMGADPKMRSGMQLREVSHIVPKLVEVAMGREDFFNVCGTEYGTRDGTAIRDYIHVWDLAMAHVKAVEEFDRGFEKAAAAGILASDNPNFLVINVGRGDGVTVRELVAMFEKVYGKPVPTKDAQPRPGDVAGVYANTNRAKDLLGWTAQHSIEDAIATALEWGKLRKEKIGY